LNGQRISAALAIGIVFLDEVDSYNGTSKASNNVDRHGPSHTYVTNYTDMNCDMLQDVVLARFVLLGIHSIHSLVLLVLALGFQALF
jgi:hypothetical protein